MELLNHTPYEAQVFQTVLDDEEMLAVIVVKATYMFARDGNVSLERDHPLPIYREFVCSELGQIWPESFARRHQAEVLVFGHAIAPGGRPVEQLDVRLRVGDSLDAVGRVFGRRRWQARLLRQPHISKPEPFEAMPLDWAHAFGGHARSQGREVPFPANPHGRGYILDRKAVDGVELPNLEDPDRLITRWANAPRPLAFAPIPPGSSLVDFDDPDNPTPPEASMTGPWATTSSTLNFAHPRLRTRTLQEGVAVVTHGMSPHGVQGFVLETPQVFALVDIGQRKSRHYCKPDTLYLYPQQGRYAVTARFAFRYLVRDKQSRVIRLSWAREDE
jgi:hypothetical protein